MNLDVLDVSLESRGHDVMACELFLRDPTLRAPLDAGLDCEENDAVNAKIGAIKSALEKLVLHRASSGPGPGVNKVDAPSYEGEVLLARWVPDIEPDHGSEASSTVGGDTWRNGDDADESFVLKQAQELLRHGEEEVDVEAGTLDGGHHVGTDDQAGTDSGPNSATPSPRTSVTIRRRRPGRRAIDALRAHKNRPFYRTASLVNLLNAGDVNAGTLQDDRDEELHARIVEARMETGEARALAAARSGGHGMGAVKRTASVNRESAAVDARRVSAGEWSLLERINEDIHPTDRHAADDSCILGSDGYPSANTTMTGEVARGLAAEIALQDVMLSSQTLSGAGGRALATELRHAISARSPTRSPERRMSTGDAIEGGGRAAFTRSPARSIGSGDSDHEVTPVTSLTGAHARQLAAELKEKLKEAEAGGPAERAAALARGQ